MTALFALLTTGATLAGLLHFTITDAKRQRVFGLSPPRFRRHKLFASIAVFGPGTILLLGGQSAAFLVWFATVTVVGWLLVCLAPGRTYRHRKSSRSETTIKGQSR